MLCAIIAIEDAARKRNKTSVVRKGRIDDRGRTYTEVSSRVWFRVSTMKR